MVTRDHFVLRGKTKYPQDRMSCGPQNRSGHIGGGKETSQTPLLVERWGEVVTQVTGLNLGSGISVKKFFFFLVYPCVNRNILWRDTD